MAVNKKFFRRRRVIIPVVTILLILVLPFMLEPFLLKKINQKGRDLSKVISFQAKDLDFSFFKGAVVVRNISAELKTNDKRFLSIDALTFTADWQEVMRGRLLSHIEIDGLDFRYSKNLVEPLRKLQGEFKDVKEKQDKDEDDKKDEKKEDFFRISRLSVFNSNVTLEDYPKLKPGQSPHLSGISATVTNLTPISKRPISEFSLKAVLLDAGGIDTKGQFKMLAKPMQWSVDGEIQKLNLKSTNEFLLNKVPLTFSGGELDLYAEAKSQQGEIEGYLKPFVKDLEVMQNKTDFIGVRHWAIELLTALGNVILRAPDKKSLATKIPFSVTGNELKLDKGEAVGKALEHGFKEKLERGIEHQFNLE